MRSDVRRVQAPIVAQEFDAEEDNEDNLLDALLDASSSCNEDVLLPLSKSSHHSLPLSHPSHQDPKLSRLVDEVKRKQKMSNSFHNRRHVQGTRQSSNASLNTKTGIIVAIPTTWRKESIDSCITFNEISETEDESKNYDHGPPNSSNERKDSSDICGVSTGKCNIFNRELRIARRNSVSSDLSNSSKSKEKPARKSRSISFSETVDKVTYDHKSTWNSQTSQPL